MHKAFKFRLYPTIEQDHSIAKFIGCSRFVYNHFLDLSKNGSYTSYSANSKQLTELKQSLPWLKESDKFALQNSLKALDDAFKRFFNKQNGYPKFKSRKNPKNSYKTNFTNNNIEIRDKYIKLPKLGWVKFAKSREVEGRILSATISRTATGKFYVSVTTDVDIQPKQKVSGEIGLDLGLKTFVTMSNGEQDANIKSYTTLEKRLHRLQKAYARKKSRSKNKEKARIKIALLHEKIANIRNDYLHKVSTKIVNENQVICFETLDVKDMLQGDYAKFVADVGMSKFTAYLEYKAKWYGRTFIKVDQYFPSSQLCSGCGYQNPTLKDPNIRSWTCPECNVHHDRDLNAAKNILAEGKRILLSA